MMFCQQLALEPTPPRSGECAHTSPEFELV